MRSLPEAATAALSQWNACSAPVLQALRNLPAPTKQEVVSLFNEDDTTNLFYAYLSPPIHLLGAGDDDPNHPWGEAPGAPDLAYQSKWEEIQNPNSSGQGHDPNHVNNPHHNTMLKHGYQYSHSTPIVHHSNDHKSVLHTYKHSSLKDHVASDEHVTGGIGGRTSYHIWHTSKLGSAYQTTGRGSESLDKHLKSHVGRAKRAQREGVEDIDSLDESITLPLHRHGWKLRHSIDKGNGTTHASYTHGAHPTHVLTVQGKDWKHTGGAGRWDDTVPAIGRGKGSGSLESHLAAFHSAGLKKENSQNGRGVPEFGRAWEDLTSKEQSQSDSTFTDAYASIPGKDKRDHVQHTIDVAERHGYKPVQGTRNWQRANHLINIDRHGWEHHVEGYPTAGYTFIALESHLSKLHGAGECYESKLSVPRVHKHRLVLEFLCPGLASESAFVTFQENPKQYFQGHGWNYVTDTPNGSIFRHPRFHGNDIIINGKSGQWEHLSRGNRVATGQSFDDFRKYAAPRFQMRMESITEEQPCQMCRTNTAHHKTPHGHLCDACARKTGYPDGYKEESSINEQIMPDPAMLQALSRHGYQSRKSSPKGMVYHREGGHRVHVWGVGQAGAGGWLHANSQTVKHGSGADQLVQHLGKTHGKIKESINENFMDGIAQRHGYNHGPNQYGTSGPIDTWYHPKGHKLEHNYATREWTHTGKAVKMKKGRKHEFDLAPVRGKGEAALASHLDHFHQKGQWAHESTIEGSGRDYENGRIRNVAYAHGWYPKAGQGPNGSELQHNHPHMKGHTVRLFPTGAWHHEGGTLNVRYGQGKGAMSIEQHLAKVHQHQEMREDWQWTAPIVLQPSKTNLYRGTVNERPGLEKIEVAYGSVLSNLTVLISTVPSQSEAATLKRLYTELENVKRAISLLRSTPAPDGQEYTGESFVNILSSVRAAVGDGDDLPQSRYLLHGESVTEIKGIASHKIMHIAKSKVHGNYYVRTRRTWGKNEYTADMGDSAKWHPSLSAARDHALANGHLVKTKNETTELMTNNPAYQGWTPIDNTDRPTDKVLGVDTSWQHADEYVGEGNSMKHNSFDMSAAVRAHGYKYHSDSDSGSAWSHTYRHPTSGKELNLHFDKHTGKNAWVSHRSGGFATTPSGVHNLLSQHESVTELDTNNPDYQDWPEIDDTDTPSGKELGVDPVELGTAILTGFEDVNEVRSHDEIGRKYGYKKKGYSGGAAHHVHPSGAEFFVQHKGHRWVHYNKTNPGEPSVATGSGENAYSLHAHLAKIHRSETGWESIDEAEGDFSRIVRKHGYKRTQASAPHGTGKHKGTTYANWSHPEGYKLHHHGENWHHFAPGHDDPKNLSVPGRAHLAGPIATGKGYMSMHAHLTSIHGSAYSYPKSGDGSIKVPRGKTANDRAKESVNEWRQDEDLSKYIKKAKDGFYGFSRFTGKNLTGVQSSFEGALSRLQKIVKAKWSHINAGEAADPVTRRLLHQSSAEGPAVNNESVEHGSALGRHGWYRSGSKASGSDVYHHPYHPTSHIQVHPGGSWEHKAESGGHTVTINKGSHADQLNNHLGTFQRAHEDSGVSPNPLSTPSANDDDDTIPTTPTPPGPPPSTVAGATEDFHNNDFSNYRNVLRKHGYNGVANKVHGDGTSYYRRGSHEVGLHHSTNATTIGIGAADWTHSFGARTTHGRGHEELDKHLKYMHEAVTPPGRTDPTVDGNASTPAKKKAPQPAKKSEVVEMSPPGFSGTIKKLKNKGMESTKAFALAWTMYKKGFKPHVAPEGFVRKNNHNKKQPMVCTECDQYRTFSSEKAEQHRRGVHLQQREFVNQHDLEYLKSFNHVVESLSNASRITALECHGYLGIAKSRRTEDIANFGVPKFVYYDFKHNSRPKDYVQVEMRLNEGNGYDLTSWVHFPLQVAGGRSGRSLAELNTYLLSLGGPSKPFLAGGAPISPPVLPRLVIEAGKKKARPTHALGHQLDKDLLPTHQHVTTGDKGDHGADPLGDGKHRMVPSGDVVDTDERNRRLAKYHKHEDFEGDGTGGNPGVMAFDSPSDPTIIPQDDDRTDSDEAIKATKLIHTHGVHGDKHVRYYWSSTLKKYVRQMGAETDESIDEMSPYRFTNAPEILSHHGFNKISAPRINASVYKNDVGHHVVLDPKSGAWMHLSSHAGMNGKTMNSKTGGGTLPHLDRHLATSYGSDKFVESVDEAKDGPTSQIKNLHTDMMVAHLSNDHKKYAELHAQAKALITSNHHARKYAAQNMVDTPSPDRVKKGVAADNRRLAASNAQYAKDHPKKDESVPGLWDKRGAKSNKLFKLLAMLHGNSGKYELESVKKLSYTEGLRATNEDRGEFSKELASLINKHSLENESNTPDFILADVLRGCMDSFAAGVAAREQWYGRTPPIGLASVPSTEDVKATKYKDFEFTGNYHVHVNGKRHKHAIYRDPSSGYWHEDRPPNDQYDQMIIGFNKKEALAHVAKQHGVSTESVTLEQAVWTQEQIDAATARSKEICKVLGIPEDIPASGAAPVGTTVFTAQQLKNDMDADNKKDPDHGEDGPDVPSTESATEALDDNGKIIPPKPRPNMKADVWIGRIPMTLGYRQHTNANEAGAPMKFTHRTTAHVLTISRSMSDDGAKEGRGWRIEHRGRLVDSGRGAATMHSALRGIHTPAADEKRDMVIPSKQHVDRYAREQKRIRLLKAIKNKNESITEDEEHLYRMKYRPPSFASLPRGLQWDYHEVPPSMPHVAAKRGIPLSKHPHGVIKTDRKLTPDEMESYEIEHHSKHESIREEEDNRETHEMTHAEMCKRSDDTPDQYTRESHRSAVAHALQHGKHVPAHVMAEYPGIEHPMNRIPEKAKESIHLHGRGMWGKPKNMVSPSRELTSHLANDPQGTHDFAMHHHKTSDGSNSFNHHPDAKDVKTARHNYKKIAAHAVKIGKQIGVPVKEEE